MNSRQRILATLEGKTPDRVAYMPITMMLAADVIGVPYGEYVQDYRVLAKGQLATAAEFGFDHVSVISDPAREAYDLGAAVHFPDDAPPAFDESDSLLADKDGLTTLEPLNPLKEDSRCLDRVMAVQTLAEAVKGEKFVEGWVEGPCAEGADLRGINHLMTDFFDDPDFVHRLFLYVTDNALRFAEAQIRAGADIIGVGDAAASLVGPAIYRDFVLAYEKRLVDGIHKMGGRVRLHICGNTSRSLAEIGTLGCDFVDLDSPVSVVAAREAMGENQVLAGNLDPVKTLRNATPDAVFAAVAECHAQAGPRFIVAAGCEIPRDTPWENINAMRKYVESTET